MKWLDRISKLYRLEHVPLLLQPFYQIYIYGFAITLLVYLGLLKKTCQIKFLGVDPEILKSSPIIHCLWHHQVVVYFTTIDPSGQIWMSHPYWYMAPTIKLWRWRGVKDFAFGSTGSDGRKAASEVEAALSRGQSTMMTPDGPAGPPLILKKGVLHISQNSGAAIVPLHFKVSSSFRLPTWDRKIFPLPFSTIEVFISDPLVVKPSEDLHQVAEKLTGRL